MYYLFAFHSLDDSQPKGGLRDFVFQHEDINVIKQWAEDRRGLWDYAHIATISGHTRFRLCEEGEALTKKVRWTHVGETVYDQNWKPYRTR